MPIYEYACRKCEKKFEKLVKSMNSTEPVACPSCGSKKTERALSVFAVSAEGSRQSQRPPTCQGCPGGGACPMAE